MESTWIEKLRADDILIIDGGMGSELQRRGVAMDAHAWSGAAALAHESLLREIHRDYIRAGADVITTNTFGTTRFVLASAGLEARFEAINRAAHPGGERGPGCRGRSAGGHRRRALMPAAGHGYRRLPGSAYGTGRLPGVGVPAGRGGRRPHCA